MKAAKAKAAKVVKEKKQIDLSKFQHCKWKGTNLLQLVNALPKPAKPDIASDTHTTQAAAATATHTDKQTVRARMTFIRHH